MCGFFTTDELDDLLFEASEIARFLLEVEGTTLDIDEEIDIEDRITRVMRSVGEAAKTILNTRNEERSDTVPPQAVAQEPEPAAPGAAKDEDEFQSKETAENLNMGTAGSSGSDAADGEVKQPEPIPSGVEYSAILPGRETPEANGIGKQQEP
jgi:hypothetical protein